MFLLKRVCVFTSVTMPFVDNGIYKGIESNIIMFGFRVFLLQTFYRCFEESLRPPSQLFGRK